MIARLGGAIGSRGRRFAAERFIPAVAQFVNTEASGGIVLLVATAVAITWANSPWDDRYFDLWNAHLGLDLNFLKVEETLGEAVNEGLMTIFFFVAGLEVKRELLQGELASPRRAVLPVAAAAGGMVAPALIYTAFNAGGEGSHGWGIPMATDIAFAMGVLALLGRRAPFALKVFLLALAIVDDLGAILVIAVFYTDHLSFEALAWAVALGALIFAIARAGVRSTDVYVALGLVFWLAVLESGLHATLAGVVLALLTPARPQYTHEDFEASAVDLLKDYREASERGDDEGVGQVLAQFETLSRGTESPLDRLESTLHPWVSYLVVPIFALANAGVALSGGVVSDAAHSAISQGVALGLVVGKPAGIVLACWLVVRLGWAELPANTGFRHILGAGMVAGIGFTVSLFITGLAFDVPEQVSDGKIGILFASVVSGVLGAVFLWLAPGEPEPAAFVEEAAVG